MKEIDPKNDPLYLLTQAVEQGDPQVAKKVKDRLDKSDNPSEMRYLEGLLILCLLYTSPSPRDQRGSRMPSSA